MKKLLLALTFATLFMFIGHSNVEAKTYKIGDTVNVSGVKIKITSAKFVKANSYLPAEKGKVLKLNVKVKNTSKSTKMIDAMEFNLYRSNYSQEEYYGFSKLPLSATLNRNKSAMGYLAFDVKKAKTYELVYQPMFSLSNKEYKWRITVK